MWLKILAFVVLTLTVLLWASVVYGKFQWDADTRTLRAQLDAARAPIHQPVVDFRELEGLPAPVQRFFRTVLQDGQPLVTGAQVWHSGTFNVGEATNRWTAFTSNQQVITQRPGFDWNGTVMFMPGLTVRVHDAYVNGEGVLQAKLLGLFSLVNLRGDGDVAEAELMRFFAEAAWYPTALLPSQGVRWEALDDHHARGTLSDDTITVTMLFSFDERGRIDTVRANARGRMVGGTVVATPWQGRFWDYGARAGMQVPLAGEVAWLLPEGTKPYWRGRITEINYAFAR